MSYTPDVNAQAALDSDSRGFHWLIEANFSSGMQRLTTAAVDIASPNGFTYAALGSTVEVEDLGETTNVNTQTLNIRISIINKAMLALLIGDQSVYRGREIKFLAQFLDMNHAPQGMPIERWAGTMDTVSVQREPPSDDNGMSYGYIEMPCIRHGLTGARNFKGLRMTHEQQQINHPGDMFFENMAALIEKPSPWLTIEFQKV